jgi:hypothetical protein
VGWALSSAMWIAGTTFAVFALLDSLASPAIKKRAYDYITSTPETVSALPAIASALFDRIFGSKHFSIRCLLTSILTSIISILLVYALRIALILFIYRSASDFWNESFTYAVHQIVYPFSQEARRSFITSLVLNLGLDYVSLLKTRLIIRYLARKDFSFLRAVTVVIFDFVFGLLLFQTCYIVFYTVALFTLFHPDRLFPASDPYSLFPIIEIMIMLHLLTYPTYPKGTFYDFLTHSHAIQIMLVLTLIPVTITSVFFYASMMPSIWLWLFVAAGVISRRIGPLYPKILYAFNFEQNPLRSVGFVASVVISFIWVLAVLVGSLYWHTIASLLTS